MVPAAELVRFSNSGTEAVMAGLRLARAYTGKDDYVILEGSLPRPVRCRDVVHADGQVERGRRADRVSLQRRRAGRHCAASPISCRRTTPTSSRTCFKRAAGRIACLLIEPIMGNCLGIAAEPEYLRAARELCDKHGVVLLIDEVKTGFRVARGGVQQLYGVDADLCTFAKAIGNGYPISVLAGREEIMRKLGRGVAHGGTYTAHSVALAAAEKTLEILEETDALERVADYGTRLRDGMRARAAVAGHSAQLRRPPVDERAVFRARTAAQLPRLEAQRLFVLRRHGARAARRANSLRAGLARALVRVGGARRRVPGGHDAGVRDRGRHDPAHGRCRPPAGRLERDDARRDRRRRRPQRAGGRVLPRARRPQGAGARTQRLRRRRGREPPAVRELHLLELLVRLQPAAPRDHARPGAAEVRTADHPVRRRLHDDERRRASRHLRQPRRAAPRDRSTLAARCRGLRPLFARRDAAMQVHQAAAAARTARPHVVPAARHPDRCSTWGFA